jgi:hypothetical protein
MTDNLARNIEDMFGKDIHTKPLSDHKDFLYQDAATQYLTESRPLSTIEEKDITGQNSTKDLSNVLISGIFDLIKTKKDEKKQEIISDNLYFNNLKRLANVKLSHFIIQAIENKAWTGFIASPNDKAVSLIVEQGYAVIGSFNKRSYLVPTQKFVDKVLSNYNLLVKSKK